MLLQRGYIGAKLHFFLSAGDLGLCRFQFCCLGIIGLGQLFAERFCFRAFCIPSCLRYAQGFICQSHGFRPQVYFARTPIEGAISWYVWRRMWAIFGVRRNRASRESSHKRPCLDPQWAGSVPCPSAGVLPCFFWLHGVRPLPLPGDPALRKQRRASHAI